MTPTPRAQGKTNGERAREIVQKFCENGVHHEILSEWITTALDEVRAEALEEGGARGMERAADYVVQEYGSLKLATAIRTAARALGKGGA